MTKRHFLTVTQPFGDYERGARIEGDDMAAIRASHPGHFVESTEDAPPEPEPAPPARSATKAS